MVKHTVKDLRIRSGLEGTVVSDDGDERCSRDRSRHKRTPLPTNTAKNHPSCWNPDSLQQPSQSLAEARDGALRHSANDSVSAAVAGFDFYAFIIL